MTSRFQEALKDHTTYSQYAGDVDTSVVGHTVNNNDNGDFKSKAKLTWKDFKASPYESKEDHSEQVRKLALENFKR